MNKHCTGNEGGMVSTYVHTSRVCVGVCVCVFVRKAITIYVHIHVRSTYMYNCTYVIGRDERCGSFTKVRKHDSPIFSSLFIDQVLCAVTFKKGSLTKLFVQLCISLRFGKHKILRFLKSGKR